MTAYTGPSYYCVTWGKELCRKIGAPWTPANDIYLRAWAMAEGARARWNPFATTQRMPGSTTTMNVNGTPNSAGVQDYLSWQQGVDATAKTLLNGYYPALVAALRKGDNAMATAKALAASPWGTGTLVVRILSSTGGANTFKIGNCYSYVNGTTHVPWTRTIKPGMTGRDVDELLRHLGNVSSFYNDALDPFDPVAKVKAHQRVRPWLWPADGIVGPKTYKSITSHV